MINVPTAFVLGAGASMDYGFPSGRGLLMSLCRELRNENSKLTLTLYDLRFPINIINDFCKALDLSMLQSVDAFLEQRPEFMEVGKAAIAAALIPHEDPAQFARKESQRWYEYLFNRMVSSKSDFHKNRVSFITFNYDRSLEYFLLNVIKNTYGINDLESSKILSAIPIIHVHGQLGSLPILSDKGRAYKTLLRHDILQQCIPEINIIHESVDNNPVFSQARDLLFRAEKICFLGFGYHPINIERLKIKELLKTHYMAGSAYGIGNAERQIVQSMFSQKINLGNREHGCLDFLRESFPLI